MTGSEEDSEKRDALQRTQETIDRQAREIEQLRRRLAQEDAAAKLAKAYTKAAAASVIASPVSHSRLMEMIVETASRVISAKAAALFLIDQEKQELFFEVVFGGAGEALKKFRIPLGHGVAGLVAVSGQPIAISQARQDPRQAADIAEAVNYRPETILCVPLFYNDQIIGVLETLDKIGAPSFTPHDMETLGLFANQTAVAIELSRVHQSVAGLLCEVLESGEGASRSGSQEARQQVHAFTASLEEQPLYRHALDLAHLVQEIAWKGEDELKACETILRGFADYVRSRTHTVDELQGFG